MRNYLLLYNLISVLFHLFCPADYRSAHKERTTEGEEAGHPTGSTSQGKAEEDEEGQAGWYRGRGERRGE